MTETINLPTWATHIIDFGGENDPARTPYRAFGEYMEHAAQSLGGLRIMDLGDGRVALDGEAVARLRREPEDADGGIDDEMRCWIAGGSWDVEPVNGTCA